MEKIVLGAAVGGGLSLVSKSGPSNFPKAALIGSLISTLPTPMAAASAGVVALVFTAKLLGRKKTTHEPKEEEKEVSVDPKSIEQDSQTEPTIKLTERSIEADPSAAETPSVKHLPSPSVPGTSHSVCGSPFNTAPNSPLPSPKHSEFQFHDAFPHLEEGEEVHSNNLAPHSAAESHFPSEPAAEEKEIIPAPTPSPSEPDIKSAIPGSDDAPETETKSEPDPIRALLERARAASKRVDAMQADILKLRQKD